MPLTLEDIIQSSRLLQAHGAIRALPRPSESHESTSADAIWRRGHVAAVVDYLANKAPACESGPLHLLDALDALARAQDGDPDHLRTPVLGEMIDGMSTILNYECGRLDCGTLDTWLSQIAERACWDRNTSEIIWPDDTA